MIELPPAVITYLVAIATEDKSLAYCQLTPEGKLMGWGGALEIYGLRSLSVDEPISKHLFFLENLFPLSKPSEVLQNVQLSEDGFPIDVHLLSGTAAEDASAASPCVWVLLLDATVEHQRQQQLQQKGNELRLLRSRYKKLATATQSVTQTATQATTSSLGIPVTPEATFSEATFSTDLLGNILVALEVLALEWKGGNRLAVLGEIPTWVEQDFDFSCPAGGVFSAEAFSPFLDNFLVDAEAFWQGNFSDNEEQTSQKSASQKSARDTLSSGIWSETCTDQQDIHLEAIALTLEGQPILLIKHLELTDSEKFQWLQTARQKQLHFIAESKIAEAKVQNATFYDPLTQLPNRNFFLTELERFLEKSQWSKQQKFAVVVLNIDRFSLINTTLGTTAGDQVLATVAKRIQSCLRKNDVPVRFGSDEFGVLVSPIEQEQEVVTLVERLLESIHTPIILETIENQQAKRQTHLTASAGIALQQPWHTNSRDLLRDAGLALQQARTGRLGCYAVFRQEMRSQAFELWNLESDLHHAVSQTSEQASLELWYQPIVNLKSRRVESFEALLRWHHPTHGWVSPARFIPLAEETGLILAIDSWVLNKACETVKHWQQATGKHIQININISPQHFSQGELVQVVQQALATHQVSPSSLRLEITESLLLNDTQKAIQILNQLKALGLEIAIDDFGTGYASLSYLQDLPLDKLKIDGYFIEMMEANGPDIVNTIISLAHKLGFAVTAERVETIAQHDTLQGLGCDTLQGYLFSRPVPIAEAQKLIDTEFTIS